MRGAFTGLLLSGFALLLAGCGDARGRGFHPAIDCRGFAIAADFAARCGPYRDRGRD